MHLLVLLCTQNLRDPESCTLTRIVDRPSLGIVHVNVNKYNYIDMCRPYLVKRSLLFKFLGRIYKSRSGWRETMIKFVMGSFSKVSLRTILWLSGDITSVFRLHNFNQKKNILHCGETNKHIKMYIK